MELRTLEYFLAITREESITGAANAIHISQPALTRELKILEEEFGKPLVIRGSRRITLTADGMLLRKRAEEILSLARKTKKDIMTPTSTIAGDIYISAGETECGHFLTYAAKKVLEEHPDIKFHISSGDTKDVLDDLDKGLIDFGLIFQPIDISKYESITVPDYNKWGILMTKNDPLANNETIKTSEIIDSPLIIPRRGGKEGAAHILNVDAIKIHEVATYSLLYNASLMVKDKIGYALTLDRILNCTGDSPVVFKLLEPETRAYMSIVWKRYQIFSSAAECYLNQLRKMESENFIH